MIFLGVDGGGTKTAFVLITSDGEVLARHESATCYYLGVGMDKARETVLKGIEETCRRAGITPADITYTFLGLPAYGEVSADVARLDAIPQALLSTERYRCDNDMICGWAASLGCQDGINIVSGTGSIAYGELRGRKARCGGWGELFSDEGSAYWIGCQALNLFSRMADGRLTKDILYDLIHEHYPCGNDLDICDLVFNQWQGERGKIASLAQLACEAATGGDKKTREIFFQAAHELALMVDTLRSSLGFAANENIRVSYSGGVFKGNDIILEAFAYELSKLNGNYHISLPEYPPSLGAAIYAAKLNGTPLSGQALKQLTVHGG
ncbi:N-acetylglucosamine kinase [Izhakiella australiensis]|uniref:N-acetylglucosamine kinase n=1 Tax=Izhakiella australiensis TaxID=1926881 RepID=A0A1S8YSX7_9GAMM|nr:BadF/BadG/BcrA/BcrD ATPase family protein [Izhakiella australiensis]OON41936.1 N-acetylglucosamine kinase [Izhakiella australiensis]